MTKLAFLSLAVLTFGAFAAEPKIPAESQAVLFLDLAKSLALPAFKDVAVPDEPFAPGMPKLKDVKWALLTADKVVIPPPNAKIYALPSLALAVSGTFDAKAALEASVKSEGPDGIKLTPLAGLPFPAWSIPVDQLPAAAEQEELKKITNLKPCVGAVAKDVVAYSDDIFRYYIAALVYECVGACRACQRYGSTWRCSEGDDICQVVKTIFGRGAGSINDIHDVAFDFFVYVYLLDQFLRINNFGGLDDGTYFAALVGNILANDYPFLFF